MFGLSLIQERLAFLGVIVLITLGLVLYGEHRVREHDRLANAARQAAIMTQKASDEELNKGAVDDLKRKLAGLLGASSPTPSMRLCNSSSAVRPPRPAASGTPAQSPSAGDLSPVPSGTPTGPDIGPGMQDLALACGITEAYREDTVTWALKQAKTVPGT